MKKTSIKLFAAGLFLLTTSHHPAYANDSFASIATHGITFVKSNEITMDSEDLYLSLHKVRVKYVFTNESDHDIDGIVTFPLPEVSHQEPSDRFSGNDPFDFKLEVNGKKEKALLEAKDEGGCGNGSELCSSQYKYYWKQTFPKHQHVTIEHTYTTGVGTGYDQESAPKQYCYDNTFIKTLERKKEEYENRPDRNLQNDMDFYVQLHYSSSIISYILQTGKNWKDGKIKHFKMTIDKGSPENLMSLCWAPGHLKKINATQFTFEQNNFVPEQDLEILIINGDISK